VSTSLAEATVATPERLIGLGYIVLPVADAAAAGAFYSRALGLPAPASDVLPSCGRHVALVLPSGQRVVLAEMPAGRDVRETGVHHGLRVAPDQRDAIVKALTKDGIEVHRYREDRAAESDDNFYFVDRDGNRIQLVASTASPRAPGVAAIDHTAVLNFDMLWAEQFYGRILGLVAESRYGVRTSDHSRAKKWAAGQEEMAPGTRRLDKLYMTMGGQNEVARANMQAYYQLGDGVLGVYLATQHYQEAPEEQLVGLPRTAFATSRQGLDQIAERLTAARWAFVGPVAHPAGSPIAASLYFKDASSNFLEAYAPR
jgi:catechol-2,3-dioxygenase